MTASAYKLQIEKRIIAANASNIPNAERVKVAFELSRRLQEPELKTRPQIQSPRDVFNLLEDEMNRLKQETLKLLVLNT